MSPFPLTPEDVQERARKQLAEINARPNWGRYHERPYLPEEREEVARAVEERDVLDRDPADDAWCERDPFDREVTNAGRERRAEFSV